MTRDCPLISIDVDKEKKQYLQRYNEDRSDVVFALVAKKLME